MRPYGGEARLVSGSEVVSFFVVGVRQEGRNTTPNQNIMLVSESGIEQSTASRYEHRRKERQ